jgi:hypothetical protein
MLAALIAVTAGCTIGATCPDMRFSRLRPADRVVIASNMDDTLRTISDRAAISTLVAFAEAHGDGWEVPWWGPRGALVRADFYADGRFLGDLGAGNGVLVAQGCGDFPSRRVSAGDRAQLMQMFGVPDPSTK